MPLRNVAIIAHVDHGKTTLVDALLKQAGAFKASAPGQECVMDSNPLERERGITILAKNCAVNYTFGPEAGEVAGQEFRINILDTPGHADFGGEVERVLRMADGCLLLVDALEGPMPQTRFVLGKALELGLRPIVVINKCDRPDGRPSAVIDEVFDLLVDLGADDVALDFPVIYASGRSGWANRDINVRDNGVHDLFRVIAERVPAPAEDVDAPLQQVGVSKADGTVKKARVLKVNRFEGLGRREVSEIRAGDLCAMEGIADIEIGDTIMDLEHPAPMARVRVDEPTLHMVFRINDGPMVGKEGKFVTTRQIAERLDRELRGNVALRVSPGDSADEFRVSGRGLLHLGVLLEGYELTVGKPEVIEREIDGVRNEPFERVSIDTDSSSMGSALELLGSRGGEILKVDQRGARMHIEADITARGLIGFRTRLLNVTAGEAVMHHSFIGYRPASGNVKKRQNGVMVGNEAGTATTYALLQLCERGIMFVQPGDPVYEGMIVGENARDNDLVVNAVRMKPFSNVRDNKEATIVLKAPRLLSLEAALEYIEEDELVEITPGAVRMRKRILREAERRRSERAARDRETALAGQDD